MALGGGRVGRERDGVPESIQMRAGGRGRFGTEMSHLMYHLIAAHDGPGHHLD
jgi:hypothetical protein